MKRILAILMIAILVGMASYAQAGPQVTGGSSFAGTESTTGSAGSLKSPATTGLTTITGPGAGQTRNVTIPDADLTIGTLTNNRICLGTATGFNCDNTTFSFDTLTGGGVILGDSSPDAAGELGYASTQLSVHDGTASRSLLQVASTTITKSEFLPIRYAEDDDSVTAPAAAAEIGTTSMIARSFAEDADNGVVFFWQLPIDYSAGIKFRVYFATDTNAGANETAVFNLSGCAFASSGAIACSEGTGQESVLELTTDEDTGELLVSGWSAAITIGGSPAAGQIAKLLLIRDITGGATEDDMVGHALVTAIEVKYQAKLNASGDY